MWIVRNQSSSVNQNGSSLSHYGVLGMKWGVRKEPEKKTGIRLNKSKKNKTISFETDLTKTQLTLHGTDTYNDYREQLKNFKLTERTNFYMPEALASKRFQNLPRIKNILSEDLEIQKVNDPTLSQKRTTNCFQCSIAYEMRRRGYDVQANTNYGGHNFEYLHAFNIQDSFSVKTIGKSFTSNEETASECYNRIASQCLSYGDGARGAITMTFPLGGGHVMNWVVEDGEFKLIDAQNGGQDGYETFSKSKFDVEVFRLDNAELLPGSTDFVEAYKPPVDIKKKVNEIIKSVGENISSYVSDGLKFVKNFLKNSFNK